MEMAFLLKEKTSNISFYISFIKREGNSEVSVSKSGTVCLPLNMSRSGVAGDSYRLG